MNFADMLQRYKNGTASMEEIQMVEEEIRKNELINEYLSEQLPPMPMLDEPVPPDEEKQRRKQEIKKINRAVNIKLCKILSVMLALIVAAGSYVKCVAVPSYDAQFYNPLAAIKNVPDVRDDSDDKNVTNEELFSPLYLAARAFTEINCPGWSVTSAEAESLGFGRYDISITSEHLMKYDRNFSCKLVEGVQDSGAGEKWFFERANNRVFYDNGPYHSRYVLSDGTTTTKQPESHRTSHREALEGMPKSVYLSAYISFDEDLTVEELLKLDDELGVSVHWAPVRISYKEHFQLMGFSMGQLGTVMEPTEEFEEMFPHFELDASLLYGDELPEKHIMVEEHFKSLLKYLTYQKEFLTAFCSTSGQVNSCGNVINYHDALTYVKNNGVMVYGAFVIGTRDDMIELEKRAEVASFHLEDVKLAVGV